MLVLYWFLLVLAGICFFLLMPAVLGWTIYDHYRGARLVACPQTHGPASVEFDMPHAIATGLIGAEELRLANCTLWPKRMDCAQGCLDQAVHVVSASTTQSPVQDATHTRIHVPAFLVATAAYWFIGAFWYSHYLFRPQWMNFMGYSQLQIRQMVELWTPHLVTLGVAFLFTFGLAGIMALFHVHGLWQGVSTAFILWLPIWVTTVVLILHQHVAVGLIWIHGGYTLMASLAAGAILGAWVPGRILHWLDSE